MEEVEEEGEDASCPNGVHAWWVVEGAKGAGLEDANEVCGEDVGEDAFGCEGLGEDGDGGEFEEEVDGEVAVDRVAVCGELVGPGEEG